MIGRSRTSRPAATAIKSVNKNFIVVSSIIGWFSAMISTDLGVVNAFFLTRRDGAFTKDRGKDGSGPGRRRLAMRHVERVIVPRRGCGRPETPTQPTREVA